MKRIIKRNKKQNNNKDVVLMLAKDENNLKQSFWVIAQNENQMQWIEEFHGKEGRDQAVTYVKKKRLKVTAVLEGWRQLRHLDGKIETIFTY